MLTIDLGDAPTPYPVTIAENGARHTEPGPTLGATRDSELDGTHSANATADGADEDGVTFGTMQVGVVGSTALVNVAGAPSGAKLDAWIDFNGDGNWGGPGEQIAANVAVVNGNNIITFDVPSTAKDGTTFARFRLSTAGNLGPEGLAADGEVEDYAVTITPPAVAFGVFGGQNTISTAADGADRVTAADVDGDGDLDLLSASFFDDKIAWYENDGSQNFTAHNVNTPDPDGAGSGQGNANDEISVSAADVDGDGDMDVLSASNYDDKIAWYENVNSVQVNLSVSTTAGVESAATVVTVTAAATSPVSGNQTVDLSVTGTNVTAGDFTLSKFRITILNGHLTGSVTFTVVNDGLLEGTETATLTISNPSFQLTLGATTSQNVAISDNGGAPPVIAGFDATVAYTENAAPLILNANATVTDEDTTRFNGGVLTISLTANAEADDRLEVHPVTRQLGVSGSNLTFRGTTIASFTGGAGATDLVITFNANATVAAVQTVLRNVTYRSVSSNPSTLPRTVQVTLTDGTGATSNQPTKTINVTALPIPPGGGAPTVASNPPSLITLSLSNASDSEYRLSFANTPTARADNTDNDQNQEYVLSFANTDDSGRLKKRRRSR